MSFEVILRAIYSAFDAWDCDHFTVRQRGKRGKEHAHSIVFTRDPTFLSRLVIWMRRHGIEPAATDVQPVNGSCNYIIGRGDEQLRRDLTFMSSYATRTPEGDCVRMLATQSRARGVFAKARAQLVRDTKPGPLPGSVRACAECGGPLPSGARRTRKFCCDPCKLRSHRRREKKRREGPWRLMLPKTYLRSAAPRRFRWRATVQNGSKGRNAEQTTRGDFQGLGERG